MHLESHASHLPWQLGLLQSCEAHLKDEFSMLISIETINNSFIENNKYKGIFRRKKCVFSNLQHVDKKYCTLKYAKRN